MGSGKREDNYNYNYNTTNYEGVYIKHIHTCTYTTNTCKESLIINNCYTCILGLLFQLSTVPGTTCATTCAVCSCASVCSCTTPTPVFCIYFCILYSDILIFEYSDIPYTALHFVFLQPTATAPTTAFAQNGLPFTICTATDGDVIGNTIDLFSCIGIHRIDVGN